MGQALPCPGVPAIEYATHPSGLVFCRNRSGLMFFFVTEAPGAKGQAHHVPSMPPPQLPPKAPQPLQAVPVQEVALRHDAPATVAEALAPAAPRTSSSPSRPELSVDQEVANEAETRPSSASASAKVAVARLQSILPPRDGRFAPGDEGAKAPAPSSEKAQRAQGTQALPGAPTPGAQASGGWFRRLFSAGS